MTLPRLLLLALGAGAFPTFAAEPSVAGPAGRLTLAPAGDVVVALGDGGSATFAPVVTVLSARDDPKLELRWGRFPVPEMKLSDTGSIYNVLTWARKAAGAADGFDPAVDRGYGVGRTADLFSAGQPTTLRANAARVDGGAIVWTFPAGTA
ncbi:MAG: hypothetical protein JNL39_12260, partial [Opitutaceae bacterium]|nr:hypothetical protein [Opitutaceae bacterium]